MLLNRHIYKNKIMPEENKPIPKGIEVTEPAVTKGKVGLSFTDPAPEKLKRIIKALNYFIAGLVTAVGATDLFTGKQAKVICFILGIVVLALGATELATGVRPDTKE
jgi:hypothetical protein